MSYRHLFSYPFRHYRQGPRLSVPRKTFKQIDVKFFILGCLAIFAGMYQILDVTKHFILPAKTFERDRFTLLEKRTAFETLVLGHQPLSARDKLDERSLF